MLLDGLLLLLVLVVPIQHVFDVEGGEVVIVLLIEQHLLKLNIHLLLYSLQRRPSVHLP